MNMIKIAVPINNGMVDDHFGHCAYYIIYSIENNTITGKENLQSPAGCGCKSNIGSMLQEKKVTYMLAGNIGEGAIQMLAMRGIQVIRGCAGNADTVVQDFLQGNIQDKNIVCHQHGHSCGH